MLRRISFVIEQRRLSYYHTSALLVTLDKISNTISSKILVLVGEDQLCQSSADRQEDDRC